MSNFSSIVTVSPSTKKVEFLLLRSMILQSILPVVVMVLVVVPEVFTEISLSLNAHKLCELPVVYVILEFEPAIKLPDVLVILETG